MCIIVDANVASAVFSKKDPEFRPLIDWIFEGNGAVTYGGRNAEELFQVAAAKHALISLNRAGRAVLFPKDAVDAIESELATSELLKSDDPHIIALARLSKTRTLCSHDQNLHTDFRNPALISRPRGSIYQNSGHKKLLIHTRGCPKFSKMK